MGEKFKNYSEQLEVIKRYLIEKDKELMLASKWSESDGQINLSDQTNSEKLVEECSNASYGASKLFEECLNNPFKDPLDIAFDMELELSDYIAISKDYKKKKEFSLALNEIEAIRIKLVQEGY